MEEFNKKYNMSDAELFAPIDKDELESEKITAPRYSYWRSTFRVFFRKRINVVVLVILAVMVIFDYFGDELKWIFGTGASGGSTFDAIWYGSRISISLAVICAAINMTIGILLGAVWGFSRKVDMVMNEVYNILGNIPSTLLISVMVMVFSPSFWTLVFAMTIMGWLGMAYYIRTRVIIIRDHEYNLASRCLGTGIFKIAMRNILPFMTSVIVLEIAAAQTAMVTPGWGWEFWTPVAVASVITVVLYVTGQNLGDASDPRTHM